VSFSLRHPHHGQITTQDAHDHANAHGTALTCALVQSAVGLTERREATFASGASVHEYHRAQVCAFRATAPSDDLVFIHAFERTFRRALFNHGPSSRLVDLTSLRPCRRRLKLRVCLLTLDHYDARHVLSSAPGGHATRRTPRSPRNAS